MEPVPQAEINFALFNKFLDFANLNSGASIPSVSAPAALGAPPQIDSSAAFLPSGVLTRSGPTAHPEPWSAIRHGQSTPPVVSAPSALFDQRGQDRILGALPASGDPEPYPPSGLASQTRELSNPRVHQLSGRTSVPLFYSFFASKFWYLRKDKVRRPTEVRPAVTLLTLSVRIMFRHRYLGMPLSSISFGSQVSDPIFGYVSGDASGVEVLPALGSDGAGGRSYPLEERE